MPFLEVRTNVTLDTSQTERFLNVATETVSELLGKPASYVMVDVSANRSMVFAAHDSPLCFMRLASIGLPEERAGDFSSALCSLAQEQLGVSPDRVYIEFSSPPRHLWGFNSGTFG
ncbi:MAG: phenylpyruvate tautomerase MIF-related protein [Alkalispirochaeta sp.]